MKKWSKKLIAILLTMVMVVSFAGCKKQENNPVSTTGQDNTQNGQDDKDKETITPTQAEPEPTEEPVVDKYEAFDFGGRTIKVGQWWDQYYTSVHTKIEDDPKLSNTETAQMRLDNVRRIEKKYNCRIEFVNLGWNGIIASINNSITAGTPECDVYLTDLQFGVPAVLNGMAQDLTKVALPNSDLFGEQKIVKPMDALDGTYLFSEQGLPTTGIFLGYNSTMIQDLGLDDPQELYKQGKWTWEKFAEYASKGTKDNDGDGTTDVYGYGGIFTDFVNGLVMNNGGSIAGSKTEGLSSKATSEAFEFINRLYNVDKSARPWNGDNWDDNLLAWSDGKVMFWTAQAWSLEQEASAARNEGAELPFEYRAVPYPVGPSGDGKPYSPFAGNWYMIPVGVKDSDKVLQIFEEYLNWHGGDPEYRDDPTWFESCFQRTEDVDIALSCGQNLKLDIWGMLGDYFNFGSLLWWPIVVNNDHTVAQAIEAAKPVLQDALNIFWK